MSLLTQLDTLRRSLRHGALGRQPRAQLDLVLALYACLTLWARHFADLHCRFGPDFLDRKPYHLALGVTAALVVFLQRTFLGKQDIAPYWLIPSALPPPPCPRRNLWIKSPSRRLMETQLHGRADANFVARITVVCARGALRNRSFSRRHRL